MSEIRQKKLYYLFFCQTPTLFRPENETLRANLRAYRYCYIVISIMGNLNTQLKKMGQGALKSFGYVYIENDLFFSEKIPGVLKTHFNAKMSEIRQKKVLLFIFLSDPTLFRPKNGTLRANLRAYRYCHIVIGIMGNLNAQLEKKLLNSF